VISTNTAQSEGNLVGIYRQFSHYRHETLCSTSVDGLSNQQTSRITTDYLKD